MNDLLWLIYFSDVISTIKNTALLLGISGFVFSLISADRYFTEGLAITLAIVGSLFFIIFALTPSKQSILMIAASKATELHIEGESGQELFDKISDILDMQLEKSTHTKKEVTE